MEPIFSYRHRTVSGDERAFMRQLLAEHAQASRRELSKQPL
jgi:hypothetical protein